MKTQHTVIRDALAALETKRATCDRDAFRRSAEHAVEDLLRQFPDGVHLSTHLETPLWLAAHRLMAAGKLRETIANFFVGVVPAAAA